MLEEKAFTIKALATATTPPTMAEVLSVSQLDLAGTNKAKVNYEANSHLPPVEKRIGVLSVVSATLVPATVSV